MRLHYSKYRSAFLFTLGFAISHSANSQTDHELNAVMSVVNDWIETLETGDLSRRAELTIDGATIQRVVEQDDGSFELSMRVRHIDTTAVQNSVQIERYWDEQVLISDRIAVFWAPYDFWIDGEFSHCGTDVFDLVKSENEWKLSSMMYTIQRSDCPESPLGDL